MEGAAMSELSENIIDQLHEGVYYVDKSKNITLWNNAAVKMTGFSKDEVTGRCCADNILRHVDDKGTELCIQGCPLGETLKDGQNREANVYLHHKNGHRVPVSIRILPVYDNGANIVGAVELFTDISNRLDIIRELEKLKQEVYTDALTMVGNRKYAELALAQKLTDWELYGIPFSVFFIDIDHFKKVNDTYGHTAGDEVLKMVAKSISSAVRPLDVVTRWGGEEFVVIVPNVTGENLKVVGERIRMLVERSFAETDGHKIHVTASLGCAMIKKDEQIKPLLNRADAAMYKSKTTGRNRLTFD